MTNNITTNSTPRNTEFSNDLDYYALNAMLNILDTEGHIQFDADRESVRQYLLQHIHQNTRHFQNLRQKIDYLTTENYYEIDVLHQYSWRFIQSIWLAAFEFDYRFDTFMGAYKFYTSYALKTRDGKQYLESLEDRVIMTALLLAQGDELLAMQLVEEIISGRFQPATPTFLNAGKCSRGELISCFLLRIEDNMESIGRAINSSLQLSRKGGGVALTLSNLREQGAPIKGIENQSSGVIPVMKLLEDSFSYANQLGARQGAGAVYLHAHHPDILSFLDTKRENADEKIRIKTLSLGVVIPDITFELAKTDEEMHLFSPYDVERVYGQPFSELSISDLYDEMVADDRIKKSQINARQFFQTLAEVQFESGYPYIMFEDTVNKSNPIDGRISMSNLCSEILQVNDASTYRDDLSYKHVGSDISCNLGSLNIAKVLDGRNIAQSVEMAVRALNSVSEMSVIDSVPSVKKGNENSHAIGLGQMNLHGFLAREHIHYGSPEALDFTNVYFATVLYHCLKTSNQLAIEKKATFTGFAQSTYASGQFFDKYLRDDFVAKTQCIKKLLTRFGFTEPTKREWHTLKQSIIEHGLYNRNLQAVPPTGSISYINNSTASIHPITSKIEIRKEGKIGRIYYPAPYLTNDNLEFYRDAYEIGATAIIDTYAVATQHVDQGLSLTLFFPDTTTTRDINKMQIYAWKKGIKTLYYIRLRQNALEGTHIEGCVSCSL
ncbi:class 1b ribonucleoside-diphosphate reductase subunit alpha [Aliivibrio kagoshimensis]|uniref:class 1b ribonucleoside-diphosphate reductase subunit alpha n=1 Tax=Aliivibrio kagoshimensis TaxID=2910230 RepID=UPI003D0DD007